MTVAATVRLTPYEIRLVGRTPEDYAQELQEIINEIINQITGGVPSGFKNLTPETQRLNQLADPGDVNDSWMSASARFVLDLLLLQKGDLLSHDGTKYVRVAGPTADGQVPVSDAGEESGVSWQDPPSSTNPARVRALVSLRVG